MSVRVGGDTGMVETGDGSAAFTVGGALTAASENVTGNETVSGNAVSGERSE